jgi:uncharacterized membrane protein
MSSTVLAILFAVHLLAAVVWIGGMIVLALVVLPGVRRVLGDAWSDTTSPHNSAVALLTELERRFTPLANLSLVVLIASGMLQMSADENYGGFLEFNNTWAWAMLLKHLAVMGMVLIAGYIALVLEPERRRLQTLAAAKRPDQEASGHLARRRARLARVDIACGLLTLLFTAIATAQ